MKRSAKMKYKRQLLGKDCSVGRHPVAATVPRRLTALLNPGGNRSDRRDRTQHAVAIPTLGWRLRVELKHICRFEKTVRLGMPSVPMDSRRYRAPFRQECHLNPYPFFSPKHQTEICL
jgi:hypothetical protein